MGLSITLSRFITMFCGTDINQQSIPSFKLNVVLFCSILLVPHTIVMNLNNDMSCMYSSIRFIMHVRLEMIGHVFHVIIWTP